MLAEKRVGKRNKLVGIVFFLSLLFLFTAIAEKDNSFSSGENINVFTHCINSTNSSCTSDVKAYLTCEYPNNTLLLDHVKMSYNGSGYYNYSLGSYEDYLTGDYACNVYYRGDENGQDAFYFTLETVTQTATTRSGGTSFPMAKAVSEEIRDMTLQQFKPYFIFVLIGSIIAIILFFEWKRTKIKRIAEEIIKINKNEK